MLSVDKERAGSGDAVWAWRRDETIAPARRSPPTTDGDAGETRTTIVRTAQRLFMERGYRAVSTRQIAEAAGLTQPALYHYFADKQDLYVEVVKEDVAATRSALERIARRGEGVEERLRQVVRYLLAHTRHDMGQMLHDIRHELSPEARQIMNELFHQGIVAPIAAIFGDGARRGLLRDPRDGGLDPVTATFLLLSMLQRYVPTSPPSPPPAGSALPTANTAHAPTPVPTDHHMTDAERADLIVRVLLYGLATAAGPEGQEEREDAAGSDERA